MERTVVTGGVERHPPGFERKLISAEGRRRHRLPGLVTEGGRGRYNNTAQWSCTNGQKRSGGFCCVCCMSATTDHPPPASDPRLITDHFFVQLCSLARALFFSSPQIVSREPSLLINVTRNEFVEKGASSASRARGRDWPGRPRSPAATRRRGAFVFASTPPSRFILMVSTRPA